VLGVLEAQGSAVRRWSAYSIADIAHFGWLWRHQLVGASLDKFPSVARWYAEVSARPAVITAISKTVGLAQ
jgi:GSH-dependent disulfide-bond oxidoreductase